MTHPLLSCYVCVQAHLLPLKVPSSWVELFIAAVELPQVECTARLPSTRPHEVIMRCIVNCVVHNILHWFSWPYLLKYVVVWKHAIAYLIITLNVFTLQHSSSCSDTDVFNESINANEYSYIQFKSFIVRKLFVSERQVNISCNTGNAK